MMPFLKLSFARMLNREDENPASLTEPDGFPDGPVREVRCQLAGFLEGPAAGEKGQNGGGKETPRSMDVPSKLRVPENGRARAVVENVDDASFKMSALDQTRDLGRLEDTARRLLHLYG